MITTASPRNDHAGDFDSARADYDAMRESRFVRRRLGLAPQGGSADYHVRNEPQYLDLIEKARDMARNDNVIGKTIEKAATNCVQNGFVLDPKTGDKALDADLKARWKEFANNPDECDIQGESTWNEIEHTVVTSILRDGDIFAIGTQDGQVQMIEGHLVRNPYAFKKNKLNTVIGIELNQYRKPTRYHIRQEPNDPFRTSNRSTSTAYRARDAQGHKQVFHIYDRTRFSQTRGVTALAPVFQIGGMFEDINFAKVVQQQVASCFAVLRYREAGTAGMFPTINNKDLGPTSTDATTGRITPELAPGMEYTADVGEKLEAFSPNIPNAEYFQQAKMLMQMIGINIGVPYVEMMMDAESTNFSGFRGALDTARRNWRKVQTRLREHLHEPVYRWKVRQWMAEDGALSRAAEASGVNILSHDWRPPSWPYIQPIDDAAGQLLRVRNGLISPRRLHSEMSQDWQEIAIETIEDNAFAIHRAIRAAQALAERTGVDVHWRELLALPMPDGLQITAPITVGSPGEHQQQGGNDAPGN